MGGNNPQPRQPMATQNRRSKTVLEEEVQAGERTVARLKNIDRWPGQDDPWPDHVAADADQYGHWPVDSISCYLDSEMTGKPRDYWHKIFRRMGFRPEMDDGFMSSATQILVRPFGPMGYDQKMSVRIYGTKVVCQGAHSVWAAILRERGSSDSPQQRMMKLLFAFCRSELAGEEPEPERSGSGKRSRDRSRTVSAERFGKKPKAKEEPEGGGGDIPLFQMSAWDDESEHEEREEQRVVKSEPVQRVVTRSSSNVDVGREEKEKEKTPVKKEKREVEGGMKLLSDESPLRHVKATSPFITDERGKVIEQKVFMKTAYQTAISIVEGYEMQQWYGKGLDKLGDEQTRDEYNRSLVLNKAAYDLVIRPTISATPNNEDTKKKSVAAWKEWHEKAKEFEKEKKSTSRFEDFQTEVTKQANRLVDLVKMTNELNEEASAAAAWGRIVGSANRRLQFEGEGGEEEYGEKVEGYYLQVHKMGISMASPQWKEEVEKLKKADKKKREEVEKRERAKEKMMDARDRAAAEASNLLFDEMWIHVMKIVTDQRKEVGVRWGKKFAERFRQRDLTKQTMTKYKNQVAPFAFDEKQQSKQDLLNPNDVISKAVNKFVTIKANNAKAGERKKNWLPETAQGMMDEFLKKVAGWFVEFEGEMERYDADLEVRLKKIAASIETLKAARNFVFVVPKSLGLPAKKEAPENKDKQEHGNELLDVQEKLQQPKGEKAEEEEEGDKEEEQAEEQEQVPEKEGGEKERGGEKKAMPCPTCKVPNIRDCECIMNEGAYE